MVYNYDYDQLNRLLHQSASYYFPDSAGLLDPIVPTEDYQMDLSYDPNGNISTLFRNGYYSQLTSPKMDDQHFAYYTNTNRLEKINDNIGPQSYYQDISDQKDTNYHYDNIGNLVSDHSEHDLQITWNIANKPVILKNSNHMYEHLYYDAMGNRVVKDDGNGKEIYIRDAQGNILAVYYRTFTGPDTGTNLMSLYLYGSSRLGELRSLDRSHNLSSKHERIRGDRQYELVNHLGNVMAVVSDRKHGIDTDGDHLWNYNLADVWGARDYYPGGMLMPNRSYSSEKYRFVFNGKENDNEIKGTGNSVDFGARIYDTRAVRWLSVDPLQQKYAGLSPYQYCANNPIIYIDPDGKKIIYVGTPEQVKAAQNIVSNVGKSSSMQTVIEKLDASDVNYYILAGSQEAIAKHTGATDVEMGGVTSYNFSDENQGVVIGIENVNSNSATQIAAMADELKTGEQFENGELGYAKDADGTFPIGYDPTDELETKIASSDALTANNLSSKDLNPELASTKIIAGIEKTPKDASGNITNNDKKGLLNTLWSTAYKGLFQNLGVGKSDKTSAKQAAESVEKGTSTVRRENGKTIKN